MRKAAPTFQEEVLDLVKDSTVAEATEKVCAKLEKALETLDPESLTVLEEHLNGLTADKIAERHGLTVPEVTAWLDKSKRLLIVQLQRENSSRN